MDSSDSELISKYLTQSPNSKSQIDLGSLLSNEKLQTSSELIALSKDYQTASAQGFASKLSSTSSAHLNKELITLKNQYLNLSRLALASTDSTLLYSDLQTKLGFGSTVELENFLIKAIQNKAIQGKLSQTDEYVKVYKTLLIADELTKADWSDIKKNLNEWKLKPKDI